MYAFNYQKVKTVADAAKVLAKDGDAKLLAGGQSLIAAMKLRLAHPSEVIDLGTIKDLSGIKADGKAVAIGAMTRHAEVGSSNAAFVEDEVVDRFCVIGSVEDHVAKLKELAGAGVDQFNLYLMNGEEEQQLEIYGREIIPAFARRDRQRVMA